MNYHRRLPFWNIDEFHDRPVISVNVGGIHLVESLPFPKYSSGFTHGLSIPVPGGQGAAFFNWPINYDAIVVDGVQVGAIGTGDISENVFAPLGFLFVIGRNDPDGQPRTASVNVTADAAEAFWSGGIRFSDFTENVIQIHRETKTGAREVPLFGEIREILNRIIVNLGNSFQSSDFVFGNLGNLRHRIVAAIQASGVEQWNKLFVNLRSSCITDMVERGYKEKTLDAMFGNSAVVRSRHYIQFRKDKEYAKALKDDAHLLALLREGVDENDIFSMPLDEILVLRDLLVNRFGTGRKAS